MSNEVPEDDLPDNLVPAHDLPDEFNTTASTEPVEPPTWYEQAGHYAYENVAKPVGGVIGMGLNAAGSAYNAIPGHDVATGILAAQAAPHLYNKTKAAIEGAKSAGRAMTNLVTKSGPVAPGPNPAVSPSYAAPSAKVSGPVVPTPAQSIVQKVALDKVLKNAGIVGTGLAVGQGLMYTSPEEVQTLKEAEQRRIAAGGQPKKRIDWLANLGK